MKWAINKKIEKDRFTRGDPMDTNQAEEQSPNEDWLWSGQKLSPGGEASFDIEYA